MMMAELMGMAELSAVEIRSLPSNLKSQQIQELATFRYENRSYKYRSSE
jgi:hypothetical protein